MSDEFKLNDSVVNEHKIDPYLFFNFVVRPKSKKNTKYKIATISCVLNHLSLKFEI